MLRFALGLPCLVLFAVAAPACAPADDDEDGLASHEDELRALTPAEIVGSIAYGETSGPIAYKKTPLYRALRFDGRAGDEIDTWVRSSNGDARAWLVGQNFATLAQNLDAAPGTRDARIKHTLTTTGPHYVVFREMARKNATFTVSLDKAGGSCALPLNRETKWVKGPPGRPNGPSLFDSARNRLVVFTADGTSELVAAGYSPPTGDGLPDGEHTEGEIAYDSDRGRAVLFGGRDPNTNKLLGDTWEWDGATSSWTKMTPSGYTPRARAGHSLAYDPIRKNVVLYGGRAENDQMEDTWTWDGASWTRVGTQASKHPEPRYGGRMTFDPSRGKLVLFGQYGGWQLGPIGGPNYSNGNTWTWDGSAWAEIQGATGGFSSDHSASQPLVYDSKRGRLVRIGITGARYDYFFTAYELVGNQWHAIEAKDPVKAGMSSYGWVSGVYDPVRERLVLGGSELAVLEVENRAPTLAAVANARVFVGDKLEIPLVGNDADGHPLTFAATNLPNNATINPNDGRLSFSPTASQVGSHTITVSVSDGCAKSERTFTVKVEIGSYAGIPNGTAQFRGDIQVSDALVRTSQNGSYSTYPKLACSVTGKNPGKLEVACDGAPSSGSRYPNGSISYTPASVRAPLENDLTFSLRESEPGSTFAGKLEPLSDGTLRMTLTAWSVPLQGQAGRVSLDRGAASGILDRP